MGGAADAQQASGAVRGAVVDEVGHPIAGAQVLLANRATGLEQSTHSGADGRFIVTAIPAGSYDVRVRAIGHRSVEQRVEVEGGAEHALRIALPTAPASLNTVVVSATRSPASLATVPSAVTVVTREEIEKQAGISARLGDLLAHAVPGLAPPTQSFSTYGQNLRGRKLTVLIDGVPQSTLRNAARDLATIDLAAVERVEVVRGPTAIYGEGATGGVINIITRRGAAGPVRLTTEIGTETSLSAVGDGLGGRVVQTAAGSRGAFDFAVTGALRRTGTFHDADGDVIPPSPHSQGGVSEMDSWDAMARLGYGRGAQRVELMANYYRAEQETGFTTDPSVDTLAPGSQKARALAGARWDEHQGAENLLLNLGYTHEELLGSRVHVQAFYRDYLTRFYPYNGLSWVGYVFQSRVASEKVGGRIEIQPAFSLRGGPELLVGLEYADERTAQPVSIMDSLTWVESGGLVARKTGERPWVPWIDLRTLGVFAQLGWEPIPRLSLRGGVRHERATAHVDDFTTIRGVSVAGGERSHAPTLFNAGAVLRVTDAVGVFANFSQGFSMADLGRVLRDATSATELGSRRVDPQEVDHYEVGVRGDWRAARLTVSGFRNESELGAQYNASLEVVRAPERVYGVEAALDVQPLPRLDVGATMSWVEGDYFSASADEWLALNGYTIAPLKLTGYVEHRTLPRWTNRLQVLRSGSRDRAFRDAPTGYGSRAVESYTVVDLLSRFALAGGTLSVGIENVLNARYFPVVSQLEAAYANSTHAAALGATLRVGYVIEYGARQGPAR